MERYFIKQQVFSFRDRFNVKDATGRDIYYVEGQLLSWGKKLSIYDMSGREVLYIEQILWNWLPVYSLYVQGQEVAAVKRELSFFRPRYVIDGAGWEVEGAVLQHHYQMLEGSNVIAEVEKEWFTWGDSYGLTVYDDEAALLALGVMIVIDCVVESENSSN